MIMSGQNGALTGQTGHVDWSRSPYFLTNSQILTCKSYILSLCKNTVTFTDRKSHEDKDLFTFFQSFDPSENEN